MSKHKASSNNLRLIPITILAYSVSDDCSDSFFHLFREVTWNVTSMAVPFVKFLKVAAEFLILWARLQSDFASEQAGYREHLIDVASCQSHRLQQGKLHVRRIVCLFPTQCLLSDHILWRLVS